MIRKKKSLQRNNKVQIKNRFSSRHFLIPSILFVILLIFVPVYLGLFPSKSMAECSAENYEYFQPALQKYQTQYNEVTIETNALSGLLSNGVIDNLAYTNFKSASDIWVSKYKDFIDAAERHRLAWNNYVNAINLYDQENYCGVAVNEYQNVLKVEDALEFAKIPLDNARVGLFKRIVNTNDPFAASQTYLKFIKLDAATLPKDPQSVVVAVIDDGVYINHEDLNTKIWKNEKENGRNGIDDDNNGYIDDYRGWDFVGNTPEIVPKGSHGTHIAGIIAAITNNNIGIQGMTDATKIMPLIVCDKNGCDINSVIKAIHYAVDNGADIINLSLGTNGTNPYQIAYDDAIKYAFEHGVLVVASAGNGDIVGGRGEDTGETGYSPVCNDGTMNMVLGVGSVSLFGYRSEWSNYGKCVDVIAPGEDIYSTGIIEYDGGNSYSPESGTSFSAPIVVGAAALLKEQWPDMNPKEIIHHLIATSWSGIIDVKKALSTDYQRIPMDILPRPTNGSTIPSADNHASCSTYGPFSYLAADGGCHCMAGYDWNKPGTEPGTECVLTNPPSSSSVPSPTPAPVVDASLLQNLQNMGIAIHALVKLQDDGNPNTQGDSAVYYIGADGKRHSFPNSHVFYSWFTGFSGVRVVTSQQLASIPLGLNVRYKPGSRMVKFTTDPKVYVISRGGVLRWVKSEGTAVALYGSLWNKYIDDLSDTFYNDYTFGADVSNASDFNISSQGLSVATISADYGL